MNEVYLWKFDLDSESLGKPVLIYQLFGKLIPSIGMYFYFHIICSLKYLKFDAQTNGSKEYYELDCFSLIDHKTHLTTKFVQVKLP